VLRGGESYLDGYGATPVVGGPLSEGPVDADSYIVGPGDRFHLVIWGAIEYAYELVIGPEGKLFVPNVGVIDLGRRTLTDARETIRNEVLGVFRDVEVGVMLTWLRRFKVHVVGGVEAPGSYPASAVTRVSEVLDMAGGLLPKASSRRIVLRTVGGEPHLVDLVAFKTAGALDGNPFVTDGAVIEVPRRVHFVTVSGAVVSPGSHEPVPGERLSDLIHAIGGLRPSADTKHVTLSRFVSDSQSEELTFAYVPGGGVEADPEVLDGDRIFIPKIPDWHRIASIVFSGAVKFPGLYTIPDDGIPLSSAMELAGGFTERANLSQAHIIRSRQPWTPAPGSDAARSRGFGHDFALVQASLDSTYVICDFSALFAEGDSTQDLTLVDGDIVQIPEWRNEVRILGMVRSPGAYAFETETTVADYIRLAGGFDKDADKKRTQMALFGGGPLRSVRRGDPVSPGAVVWVPAKERVTWWQKTREFTGLAVQVASLVVIIDRLIKN